MFSNKASKFKVEANESERKVIGIICDRKSNAYTKRNIAKEANE